MIGVLRSTGDGVAPPQPTLDAIPSLVEESRAAGMHVRSRIEADGGEVTGRPHRLPRRPGGADQRPQARARRGGGGHRGAADEQLVVEVVRRRSALAPAPQPGGSGLIGLTERVELAGGALEHGPNRRGDFVLRAVLPWT